MKSAAKSVIAVHDLSCVGRCSLTIVMPTLAAMGVQPVPLPTAVLSTHTGGFEGLAAQNLNGFMKDCIAHWKTLDFVPDAVYSGYLADVGQVALVRELIDRLREKGRGWAVVDPVMGDNGRMYSAMPKDMPDYMKALCDEADLITPNLTEAALMLHKPYPEHPMDENEVYEMLCGFKAGHSVITSAVLKGGIFANVYRKQGEDGFWLCPYNRVPVHYPGTGDLFTSVLTGELVNGGEMSEAVALAGAFVRSVMEDSSETDSEPRYGVQLERGLKLLVNREECAEKPVFIKMEK